jgi:hypothetical protein
MGTWCFSERQRELESGSASWKGMAPVEFPGPSQSNLSYFERLLDVFINLIDLFVRILNGFFEDSRDLSR